MAGTTLGGTYSETFGTTSPVTGSAPTSSTDGQALSGLSAITLVVSAAAGTTLSGAGSMLAYMLDGGVLSPNGIAQANGDSGVITTAFLAYDAQSGNFTVGQVVTGGTSAATGTISADTDAGATGVLTLTGVVGVFADNEAITDPLTGAATVNGVAYKTLAYDNQSVAFEIGQVVTGGTSAAVGAISALTSSVLTFPLSTVTGVFVDDEALLGTSQPRWLPLPSANFNVTATGRDQAFDPVLVETPRRGSRIKWVPSAVTFSSGSGGVRVSQLGYGSSSFVTGGA
jgi:hypothetical protein